MRWSLLILIWGGVVLVGIIGWFLFDLPPLDPTVSATRQPNIVILDRHGTEIAAFGDRHAPATPVSQLPHHVTQAFTAVEDRRFYHHIGLDPVGLMRAAWVNLKARGVVQGGSTITQQLAKTLFLTPERSLRRKIQEAALSLWLEHKYSKDQILGIYLNRIYFGAGAYGIEAAARIYFNTPARELSLYQGAVLAGLPKAPSRYTPRRDPLRSHERAETVLKAMHEAGHISSKDRTQALTEGPPPAFPAPPPVRSVRYFVDWILPRARAIIGGIAEDVVVRTTLDSNLQAQGESLLGHYLQTQGETYGVDQAALASLTPDGAVRVMIGGREYDESQYNRATQAHRQPGSAFKLFVYLAALEAGLSPQHTMIDAPVTVEGWSPANYGGTHAGTMTLAEAFADSVNSIAVKLTEHVGRENVRALARRLGLTGSLPPGPALALGTGEVTLIELCAAYATLANEGRAVHVHGIEDIRTRSGRVIHHRTTSQPHRVIKSTHVRDLKTMLRQVVTEGTGRAAAVAHHPALGKTGTSQNFRDAWFIGFSGPHITGVWFGNDDGSAMRAVTGGGLPARLWRDFTSVFYQP